MLKGALKILVLKILVLKNFSVKNISVKKIFFGLKNYLCVKLYFKYNRPNPESTVIYLEFQRVRFNFICVKLI